MPPRKYPKISETSDHLWHAYVTVGTKENGRPDRRHVERATKTEVEDRVDELLEQARAGAVVQPGRGITVQAWVTIYLDTVAPRRCDPSTVNDYRSKCVHWVYPVIGTHRLDRLQPGHLEDVYARMAKAGKADSSVLKVHRILTRALEIALRRGLVPRNVAKLIDSPTARPVEQTPLNQEEAGEVLGIATGRRNATRWSIGLALGLRQGEALGLRWSYLLLDRDEMRVWWQLRRRPFEHGCGGTCGRKRGGNCPQRHLLVRSGEVAVLDLSRPKGQDARTGLILKEPKGKSKRTVPLPIELVQQLLEHKAVQDLERALAGDSWQDHDFVFTDEFGLPLEPANDYREWKAIAAAAGVPAAKVHDGRHTAATIMIALGVPIEVVQEVLGHSDPRVTRGYVHVASAMARSATQRIGSALLKKPNAR